MQANGVSNYYGRLEEVARQCSLLSGISDGGFITISHLPSYVAECSLVNKKLFFESTMYRESSPMQITVRRCIRNRCLLSLNRILFVYCGH